MRFWKCPKCEEFPKLEVEQHLLFNRVRVYCPNCLRTTSWHTAIFASDACRKANEEWENKILDEEYQLEELI